MYEEGGAAYKWHLDVSLFMLVDGVRECKRQPGNDEQRHTVARKVHALPRSSGCQKEDVYKRQGGEHLAPAIWIAETGNETLADLFPVRNLQCFRFSADTVPL